MIYKNNDTGVWVQVLWGWPQGLYSLEFWAGKDSWSTLFGGHTRSKQPTLLQLHENMKQEVSRIMDPLLWHTIADILEEEGDDETGSISARQVAQFLESNA